ncbi:MAG: DUF4198 domain-containing protein [Sphingomicrobium sp.]
MKIRIAALGLLMAAAPAVGHDFWIQPIRFQVDPGTPIAATFQVGHGKFRDRWNNNQRIVALNDFLRGVPRDLRPQLRNGASYDLATSGAAPGLHVIAMQSNYATSELPAIRFNDYAREEGLAPILAARKAGGNNNAPGRERYSRRAKALVQVGPVTASNQAFATRAIGLKLEIIPDLNPYALGANRMLPVHVLYEGRRLPNATVKLTNLGADERPVAIAVTDRAGRARFRIPTSGAWLINVIWSEPVRDPNVEFDTTFSSLTFGYGSPTRQR